MDGIEEGRGGKGTDSRPQTDKEYKTFLPWLISISPEG